jgi:predicted DNA-binding transcriptional regulator AlpA
MTILALVCCKRLQQPSENPLRKEITRAKMLLQPRIAAMRNENSLRASIATIKRGFNRIEAAAYIGISPTKFDQLVADGRMPKAKRIDGRKVWDLLELNPAFEELGSIDTTWDDVRENQEVPKGRL